MVLKKGDKGKQVKVLQLFLNLKPDGDFGPKTEMAVKNWQRENGLKIDGIVGPKTLDAMGLLDSDLTDNKFVGNIDYDKYYLNSDEYYIKSGKNDWIFLHHTAGWHKPKQVVYSWEVDKRGRVGTEWIMGGPSIKGTDNSYDGKLIQCMPENGYGWHLSIGNNIMHRNSVGIEVCNFGFLTKGGYFKWNQNKRKNEWIQLKENSFYTYVGTEAHSTQIVKLDEKFRGYEYWHRYSYKQIQTLKDWILFIAERDSIDPRKGLVELIHKIGAFKAFDKCDPQMCLEQKGLWLHTNVVRGKVDLFPQQDLVDMLISL